MKRLDNPHHPETILGTSSTTRPDSPVTEAQDTAKAYPPHVANVLAEAEALRSAMGALTQDLRMDELLDTLFRYVQGVIPYDRATALLTEGETFLFVARESPPAPTNRPVVTLELKENPFLQRVVHGRKNVYLRDTLKEADWRETKALRNIRCWIAVPLNFTNSVLGVLSLGRFHPETFTTEHFRLAKTLALPFALAVQNARLREWAVIYAAERECLLAKVEAIRRE